MNSSRSNENYETDDEGSNTFSKWMKTFWTFWQRHKGFMFSWTTFAGAAFMFKRMIYDHILPITDVRNLMEKGSVQSVLLGKQFMLCYMK